MKNPRNNRVDLQKLGAWKVVSLRFVMRLEQDRFRETGEQEQRIFRIFLDGVLILLGSRFEGELETPKGLMQSRPHGNRVFWSFLLRLSDRRLRTSGEKTQQTLIATSSNRAGRCRRKKKEKRGGGLFILPGGHTIWRVQKERKLMISSYCSESFDGYCQLHQPLNRPRIVVELV